MRHLRRACARGGDTLAGHRVVLQQRRNLALGQSFYASERFEESRHFLRIEAGASQQLDAHGIRLDFLAAREVDALLKGDALAHGDRALDRLAASAAGCAEQDRCQHGRSRCQRHARLG